MTTQVKVQSDSTSDSTRQTRSVVTFVKIVKSQFSSVLKGVRTGTRL